MTNEKEGMKKMIVKNLNSTECYNVGDLIAALQGVPRDTKVTCYCSDRIVINYDCDVENESNKWIEIDS